MNTEARPGRAFAHPLWITALFVLVVNDHFLKGAGVLPAIVTGKLSDIVGLLVAPWVLAVLLRARSRGSLLASHVAVGAGFGLINVWPLAARAVEAATAVTPLPWTITADVTDVYALPALAVSWLWLVPAAERSERALARRAPRAARAITFATGLFACVATSSVPGPTQAWGVVAVGDGTQVAGEEERDFTVRAMRSNVQVDCEAVAENPALLSPDLFAVLERWNVSDGRTFGLVSDETRACTAYIVDTVGAPSALFFWSAHEAADQRLPGEVTGLHEVDGAWIAWRDGRLRWTDHAFRYPAPSRDAPDVEARCRVRDAGASLAWDDQLPQGTWTLASRASSPDGCHQLAIEEAQGRRFYICTGDVPLPLGPGERFTLDTGWLDDGSEQLFIAGEQAALALARGPGALATIGLDARLAPADGCAGERVACGGVVEPLRVLTDDKRALEAGDVVALDDERTLHLVRAENATVVDGGCERGPLQTGAWFETVVVNIGGPR